MAKKTTEKNIKSEYTKSVYYEIKRKLLAWEKNNYTQLAVVRDTNGIYKMFDHSAIIFVCQVAERLKIAAKTSPDTDFELTTEKPVYVFRDLKLLEKQLEEAGIKKSVDKDPSIIYNLGYKVEPGDLIAMQAEDERMKEMINQLVLPVEVYPGLRNELRQLTKKAHEVVRKMEATTRTMVGDSILAILAGLVEDFIIAANGHESMDAYLERAVVDLRRLDAKMMLLSDLRQLEDEKILEMIQRIARVQKKVAGAIQKQELDKKRQHASRVK